MVEPQLGQSGQRPGCPAPAVATDDQVLRPWEVRRNDGIEVRIGGQTTGRAVVYWNVERAWNVTQFEFFHCAHIQVICTFAEQSLNGAGIDLAGLLHPSSNDVGSPRRQVQTATVRSAPSEVRRPS